MNIVLIDGGLTAELEAVGYEFKFNTRLWTGASIIHGAEKLKEVHKKFLLSGAQVISTATYQLSIDLLRDELKCTIDEAKDVFRKAVRIAKEAIVESKCENRLVAGSIGPYGASLCDASEYDGSYVSDLTIDFLAEWHRPRLECLLEEGCDLIAFETIPSIKEATALLKLFAEYPSKKAWLSFSCKDGEHICIGDKFKDAYEAFKGNEQLIAIGVNCVNPRYVSDLLRSVPNEAKSIPFIIYSNDDNLWDHEEKRYISMEKNADFLFEKIPEWIDLGAIYIGGCCRINAADIETIQKIIHDYVSNHRLFIDSHR